MQIQGGAGTVSSLSLDEADANFVCVALDGDGGDRFA